MKSRRLAALQLVEATAPGVRAREQRRVQRASSSLDSLQIAVIRLVAEQQSTDELIEALRCFVEAAAKSMPITRPIRGPYIAGRRMDVRTTAWESITISQILYAFRGSVVRDNLIDAPWIHTMSFDPAVVYVRTPQGVFRTKKSDDLFDLLPSQSSLRIHRSLVANAYWVKELDTPDQLRIRTGKAVENLKPSRRNFEMLLGKFQLRPSDFR